MSRDLSTAHFYGVPFVVIDSALDRAIGEQREQRRLIQPAIPFANDPCVLPGRFDDGVTANTEQQYDIS